MGLKTKAALASLGAGTLIATAAAATGNIPGSSDNIKSFTIKRQAIEQQLTLAGQIDAEEKVNLRFQTSGRLSWVGVKTGDHVKKYQVIATLDRRELQKKLEKDLNSFLAKRWDLDQTRDDYKYEIITDELKRIIDKSQFDLNKSIIDVELQDLAIEYSRLFSPIEGIVTKVDTPYAGVNITPAGAEFEIVNPATYNFVALADQTEVVQLNQSDRGELLLDSFPDNPQAGYVERIDIKPKTGETGTVYAVVFKTDKQTDGDFYRLGMTGDLTFTTLSKKNVLIVPIEYVTEENGSYYVYLEKNGKIAKKKIKIGIETDNYYEVISGLSENDKIYDQAPKGLQGLHIR